MSEFDSLEDFSESGSKWTKVLIVGVIVLIVAILIGSIGHFIGTGWFGYRSILYGRGDLYVLNFSDEERQIVVDGRAPVEVLAQNAQIVEIIGGTSEVKILDAAGKVVDTYQVTAKDSHAFLNISDDSCLVVADMTAFYGGGGPKNLIFKAQLKPDDRVYIPNSTNVVWPRRDFPLRTKSGGGPVTWIELVGCSLFDDPQTLDGYMHMRLEDRFARNQKTDEGGAVE